MGQNCAPQIKMCYESVRNADAKVYCDGGSTREFFDYMDNEVVAKLKNTVGIADEYRMIRQEYIKGPTMNGKQRNFYLEFLKKNYPGWWALCLDADEILEDDGLDQIKKAIQTLQDGMYSIKMEHLIGDLLHVDATRDTHFVGNRLFKINDNLFYPEVEHPLLSYKGFSDTCGYIQAGITITTIWHLAYVLQELVMFKERYENNIKNSNIHDRQFLDWWYSSHIFGTYPKKQIKPEELPTVLLKELGFDKDQFYFMNRGIDIKHPLMVKQWNDYFKPKSVLDLGCGRGPYLSFWEWFVDRCYGMELSAFAINNKLCKSHIFHDSVTNKTFYPDADLITAIDVLEHLTDEQLDEAMKNIVKNGHKFLFSVPVIGDPNLELDKTHKQYRTRANWIKLWESYGIKITIPPENWLYRDQLFIGEKI